MFPTGVLPPMENNVLFCNQIILHGLLFKDNKCFSSFNGKILLYTYLCIHDRFGYLGNSYCNDKWGYSWFLIYYHISRIIIISTRHLKPFAKIVLPFHLQNHYNNYKHRQKLRRKTKKYLTRKNRLLVKVGRTYGMYTIIIFTPILISLILGAFLLRKYYGDRREAVPLMLVSIIVEGALLVIGYWYMMGEF